MHLIVHAEAADEDSRGGTLQSFQRLTGALERFPRGFEEQPLLGIQCFGLSRREPEECRVERVDGLLEEATLTRMRLSRQVGVAVVVAAEVPAIRRDVDDRVTAFAQQFPEKFGRRRPSRETAPHADEGDRFWPRILDGGGSRRVTGFGRRHHRNSWWGSSPARSCRSSSTRR